MSREFWKEDEEGFYPGLTNRSIYDVPTLSVSRLLEGQLSFDTWRRTFFDRDSLSPQERTAYTDRIKKALGGSPVTDALVNVLTNPFVWFTFVTTPAGATALRNGGRLFSHSGQDFVKWASQNEGVLATFRLLGADQLFMGTPIAKVVDFIAKRKRDLALDQGQELGPHIRKALEFIGRKHGVRLESLDPDKAPRAARADLQSLRRLLSAFMEFGDGGTFQKVDGKPVQIVKTILQTSDGVPLERNMALDDVELLESALKKWRNEASGGKFSEFLRELGNRERKYRNLGALKSYEQVAQNGTISGWNQIDEVMDLDFDKLQSVRSLDRLGATVQVREFTREGSESLARRGAIQKALESLGSWDLAKASIRFRNKRLVQLYGDERHWAREGTFKIDPDKVMRFLSSESLRAKDQRFMLESLTQKAGYGDEAFFLREEGFTDFVSLLRKGGSFEKQSAAYQDRLVKLFEARYGRLVNDSLDGSRGGGSNAVRTDVLDVDNRIVDDLRLQNVKPEDLRRTSTVWNVDDLEGLRNDLSDLAGERVSSNWNREITRSRNAIASLDRNNRFYLRTRRLDWGRGLNSFAQRTENQVVRQSSVLPPDITQEIKDYAYRTATPGTGPKPRRGGSALDLEEDALSSMPGLDEPMAFGTRANPPGGYNLEDVLDMVGQGLRESGRTHASEQLQHVILPRAFGESNLKHTLTMQAVLRARQMAGYVADSALGQAIRDSGSFGRNFVEGLKDYSSRPVVNKDASTNLQRFAGYLYSTHMGLNIPTVILNSLQPFMQAGSWGGYKNVLASYQDAFKSLGSYARWRSANPGLRLDRLEKRDAIRRLLDPEDTMGLTDDMIDTIDEPFESIGREGLFKTLVQDVPLKLFEKAEWMNRLVTFYTYRRLAEQRLGKSFSSFRDYEKSAFNSDVKRFISQTQFTVTPTSSPVLMLGSTREGPHGNILANPLARMFLQFPTRTLTSLLSTSRGIAGGRREVLGREFDLGGFSSIYDLFRMVGAGAVIYEVGKSAGMDLSRAVAPAPFTELVGGDRFTRSEGSPIPYNPPVLSIPTDLVRGLMGGDMDLVNNAVYRMLPGGIAINRMTGLLPDIGSNRMADVLQKRYADWGAIQPDGRVPIRDSYGRMVDMPNATELVLRGIGFDFTKANGPQDAMAYMMRNKERYQEAKWRVLRALRANNQAEAKAIQMDFRQRTGIPIVVKPNDLDRFIKNADMTLPERVRKTLPAHMRDGLFPPEGPGGMQGGVTAEPMVP